MHSVLIYVRSLYIPETVTGEMKDNLVTED